MHPILLSFALQLLLPSSPQLFHERAGASGHAPLDSVWVEIAVTAANIRSGPSAGATSLGVLSEGTKLLTVGRTGSWYEVIVPRGFAVRPGLAYVHASTVREIKVSAPFSNRPPPTAPRTQPPAATNGPAQTRGTSSPRIEQAAGPTIMIYGGVTPFRLDGGGYSIQLNAIADKSPFPSFVDLATLNTSHSTAVGLGVNDFFIRGITTNLEATFGGDLQSLLIGVGLEKQRNRSPGSHLELGAGLSVNSTLVTGQIGTVGSRPGDIFLLTPDDQEYEAGAGIHVSGFAFGGEGTVSARYHMNDKGFVFAQTGYRWTTRISKWSYEVRDANRSSPLPSEGFSTDPPPFFSRGFLLRIGVGF